MAVVGNQKLAWLVSMKDLVTNLGSFAQIGPASIDLRLGTSFKTINTSGVFGITLGDKVEYQYCKRASDYEDDVIICPGEFILATTMEKVRIPKDMCAFVQGRSSIGRIGLTVQNAGFVDPGFYGEITLELVNESPFPIRLTPGYRIAQLVLMDATEVTEVYEGKYNGQEGATGSRMHLDREARNDG